MNLHFSTRFSLVLTGVFLATVAVAPLAKLGIEALLGAVPQLSDALHLKLSGGEYDFGRVYRRLFMLVALILVLLARRWLGRVALVGMDRDARRARMFGGGLLLGVVSWTLLLVVLALTGRRTLDLDPAAGWMTGIASALAVALLVSLIEELAIRGYLLGGLRREWPLAAAVLATSALYSALHFLKAAVPTAPGWDPGIGLRALIAHFRPLGEPRVLLPFVGLTLVGIVLAYAYVWTRSLPFAIGLHTGWVLMIQLEGVFVSEPPGQAGIYGERGILAGAPAWIFLLLMLAVLRLAGRRESSGTTDPPRP